MAEYIYYFDGYSSSGWTDPGNVVDGSLATRGSAPYPGPQESRLNSNTSADQGGTITKVEIRVYFGYQDSGNTLRLTPWFGGSSEGDDHDENLGASPPAAGPYTGEWIDITSDTNAPGTWSWTDVANLDVNLYGNCLSGGYLYAYKVEVRVTSIPPKYINFTELHDTPTLLVSGWNVRDIGFPANTVGVVMLLNNDATFVQEVGAREVDSVLDRKVWLHEAEGGGYTSSVMHVQTDSDGNIELFGGDTGETYYIPLGYYGVGITYTETFFGKSPTVQSWTQFDLGKNNVVYEIICKNLSGGDTAENVGVREVGSSLDRYMDIHEAEPAQGNHYTSYAQSDDSGNVEFYREDIYGTFQIFGYFSKNVQLEERFDDCTPSDGDGTWSEKTIVAGGADCVGLIACMHESNGTEELTGARGGASSVDRYWLEHESESDQYTGDTLPVLIDENGNYDTYFGDVSDAFFHCLGYLYDIAIVTVALNTADETDFGSDDTPDLSFTGTDEDGDSGAANLSYNIQIDTVDTFDSQGSTPLLDKESDTDAGFASFTPDLFDFYDTLESYVDVYAGYLIAIGQTFYGTGEDFTRVIFALSKLGAPTGNIVAKLYAHTGVFGTSGIPTGAVLATSNPIDITTIRDDGPYPVSFDFAGYTLANGTPYCISCEYSGGDVSNNLQFTMRSVAPPTHEGNLFYYTSSWLYPDDWDAYFYAYVKGSPDADPFASNQPVTYTVQVGDALDDDTYYWRVRGLDAENEAIYGDWSEIREFYVAAGAAGWTGKVNAVTNPAKVNGVANIEHVNNVDTG
jgi:hypothetical protein